MSVKRKLNWVLITDLHFGARNDSKIFYRLYKNFYLNIFLPYLKNNNIKTLFMLGDFFDRRKFINFETLKLSREIFFDPLKEMGVQVHAIVGNHDVFYKNTNSLNSLELLIKSNQDYDNVFIYTEPTTTIVDDVKVLMLPWINQENYKKSLDLIKNSDGRFVFGHLELKGFEYHKGMFSDRGHCDTDLLERYEFVFSGHYHHRSNKRNIFYLGTPYELTWADYNDPKGFHLFDGTSLTFIENPIKNFVKIIYNDKDVKVIKKMLDEIDYLKDKFVKIVVRKKDNFILFERFVEKIEELGPADINIIDETNFILNNEETQDEELFFDTLDIINNFINNELKTDLSKEKLMRKIKNIYNEAKNLENGDE